jgi:hypothetical protein
MSDSFWWNLVSQRPADARCSDSWEQEPWECIVIVGLTGSMNPWGHVKP